MGEAEKPSGDGWKVYLLVILSLLACAAQVALIGWLTGFDPNGPRLAIQYFFFANATAFMLGKENLRSALDLTERWKGPVRLFFIPAYCAVCLAISFASLAVAQAAAGMGRRLFLPGVDPAADWLLWPVVILSAAIAFAIMAALRSRLGPRKP